MVTSILKSLRTLLQVAKDAEVNINEEQEQIPASYLET